MDWKERLRNMKSSTYLSDTRREFALYTAEFRSIPRASDGLKGSQRKMLWTIRNVPGQIKTASLAGQAIADEIYVHGEKSAADAASHLAAPFCNNLPLLQGEGNFGKKVAPGAFGAARYTYLRKNDALERIMYADLDIVPLKENHDGSTMEPETFLPLIPTILLNGISGMTLGWSTEILPHRLPDIVKATLAVIKGKPCPKLIPFYEYLPQVTVKAIPDEEERFEFAGKVVVKNSSEAEIVELPPGINLDQMLKKLDVMLEAQTIIDYEDNSSKDISVMVKFKRGTLTGLSEDKVIDLLRLRTRATQRIIALDWEKSAIRTFKDSAEVVTEFVAWRRKFYAIRYQKRLDEARVELAFWQLLKLCIERDLPAKFKALKNKAELIAEIDKIAKSDKKTLYSTAETIERVAGVPAWRWVQDEIERAKEKIAEHEAQVLDYEDILAKPTRINDIFASEVESLLKIKYVR